MSCQSHRLKFFLIYIYITELKKIWKISLVADKQYVTSSNHIFSLCLPSRAFSSFFVNLEFSGHQIIDCLSIAVINQFRGHNSLIVLLSNFLNWLTWRSSASAEENRCSKSRNHHNNKVRGTLFFNTFFLRSNCNGLTWVLTNDVISQKDVYIFHKYSNLFRHYKIIVNVFCSRASTDFFRSKHKVFNLTMHIQIC